ncbi:translocation/assembly module TamB domain-containing protein [Prosthecobacter sp.]|uniref:translocation/assembly module TamB domain-containing protein n=1 Tax=Prosthecobacter sp. TaxID=1965333 RepID=UPI0024897695|nr:translocation/assembly module TamB domain-containing protein [Prosthecobacter sp.]MDI1310820.1 translocation/assembly module TamB domain-containing protein [Prosthecobacter sp.]
MKRLLLAGFALLVLAVVFHESLLRWAVGYSGQRGIEVAGIKIKWQGDGSVLRDLKLNHIEASGSLVERATIGKVEVNYDAWTFLKTRNVDIVKSVVVKDADVALDLRKLATDEKVVVEVKQPPSGKPPPLVWPKTIDIENVNTEVILADGRKITVRGLSLRVGEGMPGIFELAEFKMEPGDVRVVDVKAQVQWGERTLKVTGLDLPYGAKLKSLAVDLSEWDKDAASVKLDVGMGKAALVVETLARGLFGGEMQAKVDVHVSDLSSSELTAIKLPEGVEFGPVSVDLHAEGDPTKPMTLAANGKISIPEVRAAGAVLDSITTTLEVKDGVARVKELRVLRGVNEVVAEMESKLAEDVMKSPWTAKVKAKIADVTQLLAKPPPARGLIELTADAKGIGATPTKVAAQVNGTDLGFESYKLPQLGVTLSLDGKEAKVSVPALMLGAGNRVDLNATMMMDDAMPVEAAWRIQFDDPMALMQTVGLAPLEKPMMAKIAIAGKAAFKVNDVMNMDAEVDLSVKEGRFDNAPLPVVEMKVKVAKGEATLQPCRIVVDVQNHIELKGKAKLQAPWGFDLNGDIALPVLMSLNPLLAAVKAPAIESGSLAVKLNMSGDASPWRGEGSVEMQAAKVKVAGMPEAADVDLKTTFAGTTAQIETMQAVLGPWKLLTKGTVTNKEAHLSELSFWQKDRQLMSGHAHAPFDVMQTEVVKGVPLDVVLNAQELPIHDIAAAAGVKSVPPGLLSMEVKIGGRLDTMDASVKVGVKELKAPGLTKSFKPAIVDVLATLKANQLVLDVTAVQAPLKPLTLKATVPVVLTKLVKEPALAMDLPLKATLDLPESDLSFAREFAPDMLRSVPAKLKLHATVGGTVRAPLIDSVLDLDAPTIDFVSADMPSVRDLRVKIHSHDRKVTLENISVTLAGGKVRLGGMLDAANTQDPRFDLKVEAREALVMRNPTSSVRANADVACVGTLKAARVSGTVEIVRGRVFQEVNLLPNVMGMIEQGEKLPPPPPSTSKIEQNLTLPPMLQDWTFDLKVRTRDPVVIAGNLMNGAISADIAVGGTGAAPRVTGFANVDRMVLKLPFSLLKITKGVVTMNPDNPFTPKLDVRGESRVGSHDITLYVYGDASNPKTRFTSSPPLSEADIVTLLGTGMTLGGDNSQMASEAITRAAFIVIAETYRKIFNKKKTVSPDPPKLHTTFNPSGADRSSDSVQAMYEITPKVRFIARFSQTGRMKALLGYVLKFGKAARAMDEDTQ